MVCNILYPTTESVIVICQLLTDKLKVQGTNSKHTLIVINRLIFLSLKIVGIYLYGEKNLYGYQLEKGSTVNAISLIIRIIANGQSL